MANVVVWSCPSCHRRVPLRVDECWCGFKRTDAERHAEDEARKLSPGAARELLGILVVLALGLGLYVQRAARERTAPLAAGRAAARLPTTQAPGVYATGASAAPDAFPFESPSPSPSPPPSPPPSVPPNVDAPPAVLPSSDAGARPAPDSADEQRERGLRSLQQAFAQASAHGQELRAALARYEEGCVGLHTGVVVGNCQQIQANLLEQARQVLDAISSAEESARRERVLPGDVRRERQRHDVDSAEATARRALEAR